MQTEIISRKSQQFITSSAPQVKSQLSTQSLAGLAKPIFDFTQHLSNLESENDIEHITEQASSLLNTFLRSTEKAGYHHDTALFSEYILACFLDDELNAKRKQSLSAFEICQLLPQSQELDNKFPQALKAMYSMPQAFIDVFELLYLCQSLSNHFKLINNTEHLVLYRSINRARGEHDKRLSKKPPVIKKRTRAQNTHFTMLVSIVAAIIILGSVFASFGIVLYSSEQPLKQTLNTLSTQAKN